MEKNARTDDLIPPEIVFDILVRLPVKSLCRFRCVSSLWRSIISEPQFVSAHFARSSARPKLLISVEPRCKMGAQTLKLLFTTEYPQGSEHRPQIASFERLICSRRPGISQSISGLICIDTDGAVLVCNPSTRECISLATPWIHCPSSYLTDVSFGFDPVEKKYKILHWSKFLSERWETDAYVLTLGENRWRRLARISASVCARRSLCIDGVIYCIAYTKLRKGLLVAFDVRSETIRMIPFPQGLTSHIGDILEFRGGPTLINHQGTLLGHGCKVVLWTLEGSNEPVWRCHRLDVSLELGKALINRGLRCHGITHTDEFIFSSRLCSFGFTHGGNMYSTRPQATEPLYFHRLDDASMRTVEVCGLPQLTDAQTSQYQLGVRVFEHVEGLQSLKEFHIA